MKKMIRRIIPEEDVPEYFNKLHNISGKVASKFYNIFDILLLKRIFSETFFFFPSLMQITLLPAPVTTLLTIIFLESIFRAFLLYLSANNSRADWLWKNICPTNEGNKNGL
jgi:hypothetical protein